VTVQSTPYAQLLLVSAVVSGSVCVYAVDRYRTATRKRSSLRYFAVLMGGIALWSLTHAGRISVAEFDTKVVLLLASNAFSVLVPTAWLTFALSYTDNDGYLTRRTWAVLAVEPVVVLAALLTTYTHGHSLYFADLGITNAPGFWILTRDTGLLWALHAAYSYALGIAGALVILQFVRLDDETYRWQAILLTSGGLLPVVANAAFVLGIVDLDVNLTSVVFGVSGLLLAVAIHRYRFFDLVPVARDTVVERMRDGYVVCDDAGVIVDSNRAANRFVDPDSLVGRPLTTVLPELESVVDGDDSRSEVTRTVDGDRRYLDVSTSSLDAADGTVVVLRDITDRRRAERRFQTLIERSSDMVTVLDADGHVEYVSPSVERLIGISPDAVVGERVFDLVHPDDRDEMRERLEAGFADEASVERVEYRVPNADGEWRVHEAVARDFLDDPNVAGVVVNSRDVTERKERQRELEAANEDLERTNARLERFSSVVSHDLRNPLNVAEGYTELLEERVDEPEVAEIRESHERMRRIIEDVLALAHDTDGMDAREELSLAALATEAWGNVDTADATLDPTDGVVLGDRDRLVRALENLFRNAIEHAGSDVTVDVGPLADGFYVADDGHGIPPGIRETLFEEGVTGGDGTGLGLAIVADIVHEHGWEIDAVDAPAGARFEVTGDERRVVAETA
jgi:PAS domain S-box-containing protein